MRTRALVTALVPLLLSACVSSRQVFPRAVADWRAGRRADAVRAATTEYERWRTGNDLSEAEVERGLAEVDRTLRDDVPLVVPGDAPPPAPGERDPKGRPDPAAQLGYDLLATRVTVVIRAISVIDRLALPRYGPEALGIIFRRDPFESDGALLATASPALRSLVVKRLALRTLVRFASQ